MNESNGASYRDSNGNVIPSYDCNAISANIDPPPPMAPIPEDVEEYDGQN